MNGESSDNNVARKPSRCFVCDDEVLGRSYALATCKTQNTRIRVVEKLGELVGEGYVVVISEDDVICRRCGVLISTLDRLETEMRAARDHILRLLEQKYSLKDGELRGDKPRPCQPPQIMPSKTGTREISGCCGQPRNGNDLNEPDDTKRSAKRSRPWLRCDKCKYTTHLDSFLVTHHSSDRIKQRLFCDKQYHPSDNQSDKNSCTKVDLENKENEADNSGDIVKNDAVETPLKQAQIIPVTQMTPPPVIDLSNCDYPYLPNTLPANCAMSSQQSTYVLQSTDMVDIDNSKKRTRSDSNSMEKTETNDRGEDRKQTLTLKEDRSLQMVEIMPWKETKAPNIDLTTAFKLE